MFQDSFTAQRQYYNEIVQNDENRGYFAIAKLFRRGLVKSRMFFGLVSNKVKDSFGKQSCQAAVSDNGDSPGPVLPLRQPDALELGAQFFDILFDGGYGDLPSVIDHDGGYTEALRQYHPLTPASAF